MSTSRRALAISCIAAVCIAACTSSDAQPDATSDTATAISEPTAGGGDGTTVTGNADRDGIAAAVEDFVGDTDGGADVYVRRDGTVTQVVRGSADATGRALETGEPFRVGSLSKPFIAVMVLQLTEEGSVELDEPLATYLPDATIGATITIRQLLSHQSGLANYTDERSFFTDVLADRERRYAPSDILGYVADNPAQPTGSFSYSNTNYILLGQLIEAVDGVGINSALATRITGPLGLTTTSFDTAEPADTPPSTAIVGGWSDGIISGETDAEYVSITSSAWTAGALVSTTDDLAVFLDALTSGDSLISRASFAEMADTGSAGYGLGLFQAQLGAEGGVAHNGSIPGYSSTMAIGVDSGDMVVIVTNNDRLVADELALAILRVW